MSEPHKTSIRGHKAIPIGSLTLVDIVLSDVYRLVAAMLKERRRAPQGDGDPLGRRRGPCSGEPTTRLLRRPLGEGI
jgi:hypothetical protein